MDLAGQGVPGGAARTAGLRSVTGVARIYETMLICRGTPHLQIFQGDSEKGGSEPIYPDNSV